MIRIITFGKVKDNNLGSLQQDYLKRASHLAKIELIELKNQDVEIKIRTYAKDHGEEKIILLSEEGKPQTSEEFAKTISSHDEEHITFILGPAEGFNQKLKQEFSLFSLTPLTMMHDLAQVVFLEQIYRALSINKGLPYHKP